MMKKMNEATLTVGSKVRHRAHKATDHWTGTIERLTVKSAVVAWNDGGRSSVKLTSLEANLKA